MACIQLYVDVRADKLSHRTIEVRVRDCGEDLTALGRGQQKSSGRMQGTGVGGGNREEGGGVEFRQLSQAYLRGHMETAQ